MGMVLIHDMEDYRFFSILFSYTLFFLCSIFFVKVFFPIGEFPRRALPTLHEPNVNKKYTCFDLYAILLK